MVKEAKNIDFYTTGRQPFDQDFERISEWIRKRKKLTKIRKAASKRRHLAQHSVLRYQVSE
jgi:hypothetical protein